MAQTIDIGTISVRGQVAIPTEIREKMKLKEGEKVLFVLEEETLLIKKIGTLPWAEVTKPFREAKKKITEADIVDLIHKIRKSK